MKRPRIELVVCDSVTSPGLLSIRAKHGDASATPLKRALVEAGFKAGDEVVLTVKAKK